MGLMDDNTVNRIIAMIDSRRETLRREWDAMERGTRESGENLAAGEALGNLKWAIVDEWRETVAGEASQEAV